MSEVLLLSIWMLTVSMSSYPKQSLDNVLHAHVFGPWIFLPKSGKNNWVDAFLLIFFSDVTVPDSKEFKSLEGFVSDKTLNAISDMGFTTMMEIQHKSIVPLLKGRYIVVLEITILLQLTFHNASTDVSSKRCLSTCAEIPYYPDLRGCHKDFNLPGICS